MTEGELGAMVESELATVAICEADAQHQTGPAASARGRVPAAFRAGFARSLGQLVGATAAGQAVAVLASPIITRLYSPAEFGIYQSFVSLLTFAAVVLALRYEIAIPIAQHDRRAAYVTALSSGICLAMAGAVLVGGLFYMQLVSSQTLLPRLGMSGEVFVALLATSALLGGWVQVTTYWGIRERDFGAIARARVSQAVVMTGTMVALGAVKTGILGLLLADVLARCTALSWLVARFHRRLRSLLRNVTWGQIGAVASRYRDFPRISAGGALLNTAGFALTPLLILYVYGPASAGLFALVDRILVAPSVLVSNALSQLYTGELKHMQAAGTAHTLQFVRKTLTVLFLLGVVPFSLLAAFAPAIFGSVFGESWRAAGSFAGILAMFHFIGFVVGPINATLPLLERQKWQFAWELSRVVLMLAGWFAAGWLALPVAGAVAIYAAIMTAFSIAYGFLSWIAIRQGRPA